MLNKSLKIIEVAVAITLLGIGGANDILGSRLIVLQAMFIDED
jgi:hypothetical protein